MATHSSILAWRISWTLGSLGNYSPRGRKELDMIEMIDHDIILPLLVGTV